MNLLIVHPLAQDYVEILTTKFPGVSIHGASDETEIKDRAGEMDILLTAVISDELIKKASNLKWIHSCTSGMDHILNLPSLGKDILITSSHGIHGPQVSEMALHLMLALSRNFQGIVRNQEQRIWDRWPAKLLYQKKVGILGVGVIGKEIARKCKAFGMTVYGITRTRRQIDSVDYPFGEDELLHVIPEVDYLILVVPLTPRTNKMIDAKALSLMKSTAFLINLARGEIVDEDAMITALKQGKIAGAALDAFCIEPLPQSHPLWGFRNVIITPHGGGLSDMNVTQVSSIFEENLRRFLKGEKQELINFIHR